LRGGLRAGRLLEGKLAQLQRAGLGLGHAPVKALDNLALCQQNLRRERVQRDLQIVSSHQRGSAVRRYVAALVVYDAQRPVCGSIDAVDDARQQEGVRRSILHHKGIAGILATSKALLSQAELEACIESLKSDQRAAQTAQHCDPCAFPPGRNPKALATGGLVQNRSGDLLQAVQEVIETGAGSRLMIDRGKDAVIQRAPLTRIQSFRRCSPRLKTEHLLSQVAVRATPVGLQLAYAPAVSCPKPRGPGRCPPGQITIQPGGGIPVRQSSLQHRGSGTNRARLS